MVTNNDGSNDNERVLTLTEERAVTNTATSTAEATKGAVKEVQRLTGKAATDVGAAKGRGETESGPRAKAA